ncbi:MAG: heme ABC transporter permease CcmB [Candidatus Dadabacteria bacterium]
MKKIWAIVWKDIIIELRTKELFSSMFVFALLIILIFSFTFGFSVEFIPVAAPGILWVAFTFAGVLGLSRSFAIEKEWNSILGLLISPIDRSYIFLGKMIGNMIFVFIVEAIILQIFVLFFNYNLFVNLPSLLLVILLGTVGFVSVGTLFSAMAVNTKLREVLLPVLLFPIIVPVIVSSVKLIGVILSGKPIAKAGSSLQILILFDIIFLVICTVIFEYVIEE